MGILNYANGSTYEGQFNSSYTPHYEYGTMRLPNGEEYMGNFIDGKKHGKFRTRLV